MTVPTTNATGEIADALTLKLATIFQGYDVKRLYVPEIEPGDVKDLTVFVTVKSQRLDRLDRSTFEEIHQVDVGYYKMADKTKPDESDSLLTEVEKLKLLFVRTDPTAVSPWSEQGTLVDWEPIDGAEWRALVNDPLYDPKLLKENNLFVSVVTLDYRLTR